MDMGIYASRIDGTIHAEELIIGQGAVVEEGVIISGKGGPAKRVVIGDFAFIGTGTRIFVPEFSIGDYSKYNMRGFAHGTNPLSIGRNCWFGGDVILDSIGGLTIDDNVGIGAQSQLWTHIQFGDVVEGSRFYSSKAMHVGKDAWFVGHCIVSPVAVGEKAMAMVGSVITKDMEANHIYAGVPAVDMSPKLGYQFEPRTNEQKLAKLQEFIEQFEAENPEYKGCIRGVRDASDYDDDYVCLDVSTRTYNKRYHPAEVAFLKTFTPLLKFVPRD
jgi:acetyltransferase-like isoleucine patch superfamily enzyme